MTYQELAVLTLGLLKKEGWTKGSLGSVDKPKCLLGAMLYAAGEFAPAKSVVVYDKDTKFLLCKLMQDETGWDSLSEWNDTPERKFDEVVELLEKF